MRIQVFAFACVVLPVAVRAQSGMRANLADVLAEYPGSALTSLNKVWGSIVGYGGDEDEDDVDSEAHLAKVARARARRAPAATGGSAAATGGDAAAGTGGTGSTGATGATGSTGDSAASGGATTGNTAGSSSGDTASSSGSTSSTSSTDTSKNPVGIIVMGSPITRNTNNLYYWPRGEVMNMTWSCAGKAISGTVSIWVQRLGNSQGGGGQLQAVARKIGNANRYSWAIPANFTAGTYMVFVEDDANNVISNTSLVSNPSMCQPFSAYNPALMGIYQRLDYRSIVYLVSAAQAARASVAVVAAATLAAVFFGVVA